MAITGEDGTFVIEGLSEDREYTLEAGGRGLLTPVARRNTSTRSENIELALATAYVVQVRLVDEDQEPIRISNSVYSASLNRFQDMSGELERVHGPTHSSLLAGVPSAPTQRFLIDAVFAGRTRVAELGPVRCDFEYPGYAPRRDVAVTAFRIEAREQTQITLAREVRGFGELYLKLEGAPDSWTPLDAQHMRLLAKLKNEHLALSLRIAGEHKDGVFHFQDVPFGTYDLTMSGLPGVMKGAEWTPSVVVGSEPARVTLDMTHLAGVEIELWRLSGQPHGGYARVSLIRTDLTLANGASPTVIHDFLAPPYVAFPLLEGSYRVLIDYPFPVIGPIEFDLARGAVETLVLHEDSQ